MKKREKIIGIIMLAVIAIWGVMYLPRPNKEKLEAVKPIQKPARKLPGVSNLRENDPRDKFDLQRLVEYNKIRSKGLEISSIRDPFKKLEPEKSKLDFFNLVLTGVLWEEGEPTALINGQILKTGDTISGYEIEEIRKDEVILIKETEKHVLKLFTGEKEEVAK